MSIEYEVRISEKQRKLIMRALTTTVANNRRSTSGGVLSDAVPDDWMELIGVFAALNPHMMVADDQPEHCRYHRESCPHVRRAK
jgi:cytochrome P450